jgi:hypothetical protein
MIRQITWEGDVINGRSPFLIKNTNRPIRITLHSESLSNLNGLEKDALELLQELDNLDEISITETLSSNHPYIEIEKLDYSNNCILFNYINGESVTHSYISNLNQWVNMASGILRQTKQDKRKVDGLLNLIILIEAHRSLDGDLFITSSPDLLKYREGYFKEANIYTPFEAIKIVGLFLRSHDNYITRIKIHNKHYTNRSTFYWILAKTKTPDIFKLNSVFYKNKPDKFKEDNLNNLGTSIINRCVRALQARDEIGIKFYQNQDNAWDGIMYHFDYLSLVLSGAFDAQAKIINDVYGLKVNKEQEKLHNQTFLKKLKGNNEAKDIYDIISNEDEPCDILLILNGLRNTIHEIALEIVSFGSENSLTKKLLINLPTDIRSHLISYINQLETKDEWGILGYPLGIYLEPYSFSIKLTEECFHIINSIASIINQEPIFNSKEITSPPQNNNLNSTLPDEERIKLLAI